MFGNLIQDVLGSNFYRDTFHRLGFHDFPQPFLTNVVLVPA
jgi:hypothetical protein